MLAAAATKMQSAFESPSIRQQTNNLHPLDLGWCAREPHLIGNPMLLIGFDEEHRLILLMKSHTINLHFSHDQNEWDAAH